MSDFRDSYSPPLLETIPPKSLSPPPVKLERKKPDVLPLSPQRQDIASVSPVLTPMGPGTDELDTIWEPASQLSLSLAAQHDMTSLSPQHLEQILERLLDQKEKLQEQLSEKDDQNRFLQQDLSCCTRERDVLIAQLNQLTPTLSESQLEELDGLRTCPESDLLSMEPRARRFWDEFLRQRGELETQRDIVSERDNEVRDLLSERANTRVLLEHLERLVSRHERSLRSTVVKRQTAQNGVSSEVEVLKALKCLFDHHKTLDRVKDKLKHQVARTKELEDQLTEALAQRQLSQLEKYKPSDSLGQLMEREREIEGLRFEMEELKLISESQLEQSTQQLDDSRELYGLERERREESNKKLKDLYSLLTNKERAIDKLEKQLTKCQRDLADLTQEANRRCLELQERINEFQSSQETDIAVTKEQLIEPITPLANQLIEPITPLGNQLTNPIDASDNEDLKEKLRCKETETIELREELEEKSRSERLMKLRLQQTVEKLSLVQKDKMDLEQILHERMEPANQRRGSRRTKKASRQSMHNMIAEINRMSDALGDTSHSLSHRRLQEPVRLTDRQRRAHNYSPDVTPFSSRKSSPIEETKQSPTESEGMGPALRGSHSSLSDIDTVTTVSDNSHIVDESLFERTEMDPGAPKLTLSHSRKKSLKRKSSIRRIVSSFKTNRTSVPKELPPPLASYEPPEGRLSRLEAAISSVERQNTQFLLWSPEALQGWVEVELGLPESVGEAVRWQCWTVSMLLSMGERDYEHELGIVQPLLRLKLMKAVQERVALSKASTPCLYSPYRGVNHQWIASHWLPSLGLSQYSNNFRQCCVDGRVLEHLTKKELRTSLGMVESSHRNSLQFGIIALRYLNYDTQTLEEKQRQLTAERTEMPFWSNGQVAQWLTAIGLGNYTANIESSGLHGAVLYFDTSYDYHEIAITLQIPQIDTVARKTLKNSLYELICQPRSSNLDKKGRRKSFALFHRKSPEPPQSPDLLTPGSPSPLRHEMPQVYSDDEDKANPVQFLC